MRCVLSQRGRLIAAGLVGILLLVACAAPRCPAEEPVGTKALKYHALLVSRPEPGYLFDRFYNTWLDESTVDALEAYLTKRTAETHDTADQLLLAFFYVRKGDDVAALDRFHEALAANPASAATWYHKALVEARTLDFDTAIADLKKAREQSPDHALAARIDKQLGKLLVRNGETAEALAVWQSLLASRPADDELWEDLIELHIDEGLFQQAAALAEALLGRTQDPYQTVMLRLRLGDIRHRAGNRDEAIAVYTSTLEDVGSGTWLEREVLAQIDQVLRREDDVAGLKRLYDELRKRYPKRIAIHRRCAQLLLELGEHDAAIAAYREVLQLTPGDRANREEYVTILAKVGKQDEAVQELESLCTQYAEDAELRFRLANLLHESKRIGQAIAAVDRYLEVSDGSEYAYLRAARLLERRDNKDAAARIYDGMAERFADSASAQEAYAAFLYSLGRKEEAIGRWRTLAEKADVNQLLHVARALSARGEHQAALDLLQSHESQFAKEPLFLGQLVSTSFALKEYDKAIPWALARVDLATSATELETAIDQAATTIERAEKLEELARQLEATERRSVSETCLLAELWERIGDSERADEALRQPVEAGHLLAVSEQIRLHSQRHDWSAAAAATRRILDLPGGSKGLYVRRLVELYQRDYQLEEALKWVDPWKRLSPGSTTPWTVEARLLSELGRSDDALNVLRTAALRFEDNEDLRVRLAQFYAAADKPADAERIYWQLYEQTDDLGGKLRWAQELARLAQQQGTVQQLIENFNQRVENNRRSIVPLLALSEVYRQEDDYEGRRRALTAAAKIKPDDKHLLLQIARVEEQDGDWQAAVATLQRAVPLDNTNRTREQIARLYLQYGDAETGLAMLTDLVSGDDVDPRTLETVADSLCAMQEWERAAEFLRKRIAEHPADYRLRYLLAVALEEAGETDAAIEQFFLLVENQEELPTKKSPAAAGQPIAQSYFGLLRELMPARAAEWFELSQYRHTAYAHRQQRAYVTPQLTLGSTMVRSAIQLPVNVETVRPMALSHVLAIVATLDDDRQQEVCRALESQGIEHPAAWSRVDPMRGDYRGALVEVLDEEPDNETALAMLVLQGLNMQDATLAPHYARAVAVFRESRPQLALLAAVQAGVQPTDETTEDAAADATPAAQGNKYLDEALQIAATVDKPNPMVVMGITAALGGRPGRAVQSPIGETYRDQFSRLLVKWYPRLNGAPWGGYEFYMVVQSLAQNDDAVAYVEFLDDEISRFRTGGGRSTRQAAMPFYGRSQQSLLTPLAFPPPLSDFPSNVLGLFSRDRNNNPFGTVLVLPGGDEDPAEKIEPLLERVRSPLLRILLAYQAGLEDRADEAIGKLLAAKTPSLDAYLLAAARASEREEHSEVVRLLQKARYLPMDRDMRRQVDAAIVAAVLAMKDGVKVVAERYVEAGRQACLRLRRARLEPQQRAELVDAMSDLGLAKEAEKLERIATTSSASPVRTGVVYTGGRPAPNPVDHIRKLIEQGKRDTAVRLLAGEVTGWVQQTLANPQSARAYSYQMRELRRRIESLGLVDDVLKSLDPGDSRNIVRINQYAMACQAFGNDSEARGQYERVLELRPKDDTSRTQLILLLSNRDPAAAVEHIQKLGKTSRDTFGQMLAEQLQDHEMPIEERIGFVELAVEFVLILEEGDATQPYWAENILNAFGRQMYTNRGASLSSLYTDLSRASSRARRADVSDEVTARREKVHAQLCAEMLKKPGLARVGFRHLLAVAEAKGETTDDFAARAEQILLDEAAARPGQSSPYQQPVRYYYSGSSQEVRFRSPEEFLARRAWQSGDWSLIDQTLLPKLAVGRTRQSHQQLELLSDLYRCDEAEYLDRAKDAVRRFGSVQAYQDNEGLAIAVDVWADRGLDVDLQPIVLKQLKQDVNGQNHHQPPGYLRCFLEGLARTRDRQRQLALLEVVATIYLGPPEKRNEFIRKNYQGHNISWGAPSGRIYVFGQLIEQLCQQGDLLLVVLEHLEPYDLVPVQNLQYRVESALSGVVGRGAEATLEMLAGSPWLQDLDEFRPLVLEGVGGQAPLAVLLERVEQNGKVRDEFRDLLQERQAADPTFGGGLMLAYLDQTKNKSIYDYLGGRLSDISALADDRQVDLAVLVADMVSDNATAVRDLSESAAAARQWMLDRRAGQSESLLARVNKAKRLEELGIQYGQVDEFLRQNLSNVIAADTPGAVQVFQRLCELSRDAQRRGEWHMSLGSGRTTEGWLLENALNNLERTDWGTFNFLVAVFTSAKGRPIEVNSWQVTHISGEAVIAALERVPKASGGRARPIEDRVRAMYDELGPMLEGRPNSLLIPGFCERIRGQANIAGLEKIQAWAREEADGGRYPELAADLGAAAGLLAEEQARGRGRRPGTGEQPEVADYHERFRALVNDPDLPLTWRVYLAEFLIRRHGVTPPLARDIVSLYTTAIAEHAPLLDSAHEQLTIAVRSLQDEPSAEQLLAEWRDAWADRYLKPGRQRNSTQRQYERLDEVSSSGALSRALELYLAAGQLDRVEQLLQRYNDRIASMPQAVVILVRAQRPVEAARFLSRNWPKLQLQWPNAPANRYDAELAAMVPVVSEQLQREDERYFAQLFFASMPDAQSKQPAAGDVAAEPTDRDQRLAELAGKLGDVKFVDPALKNRSLVLLSSGEPARELVAETLAGQYRPEDFVTAFLGNDRVRLEQETELAVCHLGNRLRRGDAGPLAELLGRLKPQPEDDWQFGQKVMPLVIGCRDALRAPGEPVSADQCAPLAAALRGMFTGRQYAYFNDLRSLDTVLLAVHSQAGQCEAADKWFKTITENTRRQMEQQGLTEDIWPFGLRLNGPATDQNLDARVRYVQNALRFAIDRNWTRWHGGQPYRILGDNKDQYFQRVVDAGLLTADELKRRGPDLVEAVGDNDFGAAAWAAWLQSQKDYERAAEAWRPVVDAAVMAIQAEPKSERTRQRTSYVAALGTCLVELGRIDEAREVAAMLDGTGVPAMPEIQQLRRTLAERRTDNQKQDSAASSAEESKQSPPTSEP